MPILLALSAICSFLAFLLVIIVNGPFGKLGFWVVVLALIGDICGFWAAFTLM